MWVNSASPAVTFLEGLPKLKAGNGTVLRLQVVIESSGGVAEVEWMVAGEVAREGLRYRIDTTSQSYSNNLFNLTSTLDIRRFSDADTNSEVMALASLQNATDNSTTQIIKLREFTIMSCYNNGEKLFYTGGYSEMKGTTSLFKALSASC